MQRPGDGGFADWPRPREPGTVEAPGPAAGLLVAGAVVTAASYGSLREQPRHPELWGPAAPLSALVLYRLTGQRHPTAGLVVTGLCLGVATWTYLRWAAGPRIRHPLWWDWRASTRLGVLGDARRPPPATAKLKGVAAGHFGAFSARDRS